MARIGPKADVGRPRAVGYCRVSTTEQAEHGFSLAEQERLLREFIERHGMKCVGIYIDPGISGRRADKRPDLQRMLAAADAGEFDTLVIPSLDRLGRNAGDLHVIFKRLQRASVTIKSVRGDVDTGGATGRLLTGVMASLAEFESDVIGERTRIGKAAAAASGRRNGGPRPFGYKQAEGVLTQVRHEADVVRRVRNEVIEGKSLAAVARGLNADGIRTARGAAWSQTRLSQMLSNRLYLGFVKHLDNEYKGNHTPIFTTEQWAEVQAVLEARRGGRRQGGGRQPTFHLFARGMLRCGSCGSAIAPRRTTNAQGRVYELYRCIGQLQGSAPDCTMPSIRRESIDSNALSYFAEVGVDLEATRTYFAGQVERAVTELNAVIVLAERQQVKAEERLTRIKRDYQDGAISAAEWREHRDELEAERKAAAWEVAQVRARADQINAEAATIDAEEEMLHFLADLRSAVAGTVREATSIGAVRVALQRLFDGFTLHSLAEPQEKEPPLPDGWVRSRPYAHPDLIVAGKGGFLIEPHPKREMILATDKETAFPELHRAPLKGRVRVNASGR